MRSPFADCEAVQHTEKRSAVYRGESFEYTFVCYQCERTGEMFTTTEQDEVNIAQIRNQYRAKHDIPYASEIRAMRESYGVSSSKMALILGWGENQYRLYENGDMPSLNNGKQLKALQNPNIFCQFVELSPLSESEKQELGTRAMHSVFSEKRDGALCYLYNNIYGPKKDGKYEGYVPRNVSKLKNVMLFFINKCKRVYQTQMNKLLFYADFLSYREYGHGITGLAYKAIQFGPVPENWSKVFSLIDDINQEVIICRNGNEGYILTSELSYEIQEFSTEEIHVLTRVMDVLGSKSPTDISNLSHEEDAWRDNVNHNTLIDYSYAFSMKTI